MAADPEQFTEKYVAAGRIGGALISNFYSTLGSLIQMIPGRPSTVLEIGAGDGHSTGYLRDLVPEGSLHCASELRLEGVQAIRQSNPEVPVLCQSVYQLGHPDSIADLVICLEVLEHLEDPHAALQELTRVSSGYLILSVPREPIWCALNVARMRYLGRWGNTPGHIQHWSASGFRRFVATRCEIVAVRTPLPWTMVLARPRHARP